MIQDMENLLMNKYLSAILQGSNYSLSQFS